MKTLLRSVILFIALTLTGICNAQVSFSFGPKGGATFTSFHGDDAFDVNRRSGWVAGAFMNLSLLEFISIQPEFLLHQKGATRFHSDTRDEIRLNYFTVPVLLKVRLPIGETVYPNVFAGPNFSYRLNGTYTRTNTQNGEANSVNIDQVKRSDTGGIIGAGIDIEGRSLFVTMDVRYGVGFSALGDASYFLNVKNDDITINAGIGIRIGSLKLK